ncbi:MAG TPA: Ig-like domain-containing protein, partial [Chloroflexota bacterium]
MNGDGRSHTISHRALRTAFSLAILASTALAGTAPVLSAAAPSTNVLGWLPGVGSNVPLGASLSVTFNRAMNRASVEAAWHLVPTARGAFSWSGSTLNFRPAPALRPMSSYHLSIGGTARSADGIAVAPFTVTFSTGDRLRVRTFSPGNGATGVPANGLIAVTFNHPMVPLAGLTGGRGNPSGWRVSITPTLSGYGSWLGTSTWTFHPSQGLEPSTRYTVTVAASAGDAYGETLGTSLTWSFRTATPEISGRVPYNHQQFVDPHATVRVTFDQPMDPASTGAAFRLTTAGVRVPGAITWQGTTLVFHPRTPLSSGHAYSVTIAPSARSANHQATLGKHIRWQFHAAPPPHIAGTSPGRNGTAYQNQFSYPYYAGPALPFGSSYSAAILFNTPMNKASLDRHLTVSPAISHLQTAFGGPDQYGRFTYSVFGDFQPSTHYTISLSSGVQDHFGRPLGTSYSFPFSTARLRPSVALFGMPNSNAIAFTNGRGGAAPVQLMNVPHVTYTLVRTTLHALDNLCCGTDQPDGTTIRTWNATPAFPLNKIVNTTVHLTAKDGTPLPPGLYWLGAQATGSLPGLPPADQPPNTWEIVLVTDLGITMKTGGNGTLVWVTSPQSGKPLPGVTVRLLDYQGYTMKTGITRADGTVMFLHTNNPPEAASVKESGRYGLTEQYWTPQTAAPNDTPFFWQPNYGTSGGGTYLYTDRPVYRPGQTVHFRGVLWRDSDGVYSTLGARQATIHAYDSYGHQLYVTAVSLDRFGAVRGSFRLPGNAYTGPGYISIQVPKTQANAFTNFTVAEYRKPEFLTTVTAAAPSYVHGQTATLTANVRYVFGAPVRQEPVHWTAYVQPQFDQPPGWDGYTFFDWERYWQQTITAPATQNTSQFGTQIVAGTGRTDAQGRLVIHLPATVPRLVPAGTVTVEATATDITHQTVSGRAQITTYHSALAIGLAPRSRVLPAGRPATVDVVTVHQDGTPISAQPLTVTIARRTYTNQLVLSANGQSAWRPVPHDTPISTQTVTTDSGGKAAITFTPPSGGEYVVTASGKDALGNTTQTAISIDASAAGFTDWGLSNTTTLPLKPDKTTYTVGDTAHILVAAPFDHGSALITVERGTIRKHWVQELATTSSSVDIPITLADIPNIYVTVTLYRGTRNGSPPDWRYGMSELHVRVDPRHLIVHLNANGSRHHPGDRVTYTVTTTDAQGHPVSAELSLALVDTAVLALQNEINPDILSALYSDRPLGVTTGASGTISIDHVQLSPDFQLPPGNAVGNNAAQRAAAPKAGGGGGGLPQTITVRSQFADTAYWTGALVTGPSGRASLSLTLPQNVTTWRLDARGVTAGQQVGQAQMHTLASQDLVLRPVLPRFLVQGDHLQVGVVLNNTLGRPVQATVLASGAGVSLSRHTKYTATLPAHGERLFQWPASVPQSASARVTFLAVPHTSGVRGDGVRIALPVHAPLTGETVATAGQVLDAVRQLVIVPRGAMPRPGALTVQISPSLTAGLGAAYGEFQARSQESNEDIANRVLVAASLHSLPQPLTGLFAATYRHLPAVVSAGVQKLLSRQYGDGGWPWFPGDIFSDPEITGDAVQALVASGHRGPQMAQALIRARQFLRGNLQRVSAGTRAHLLFVLATSGTAPAAAARALYGDSIRRLHLDSGSLADLGQALAFSHDTARGRTVVATLDGQAVVSATGAHWENNAWDYSAGPIIAATTATLDALVRLRPHDPVVPAAVRWLMDARQGTGWDCPH